MLTMRIMFIYDPIVLPFCSQKSIWGYTFCYQQLEFYGEVETLNRLL